MNIIEGQGLPDFVMLEEITEDSFYKNLALRFEKRQIFTYIGEQVVVMNPFQFDKSLYGSAVLDGYQMKDLYEVQPHIYALGDDTFRQLMRTKHNQCVLITGESGAGKTEASKIFLNAIAKFSASASEDDQTKEKLVASNPVLEAFGNAKTVRNDNSSRFGKYMEIQFDGAGAPLGGRVTQYLLEKSRVVTRGMGERNFHIFYQILQSDMAQNLGLTGIDAFTYLNLSVVKKQKNADRRLDRRAKDDFGEVCAAMESLGFSEEDQNNIWRILAAILHLGNITFEEELKVGQPDGSRIEAKEPLTQTSKLLDIPIRTLEDALITRTISTGAAIRRTSAVKIILNPIKAALVKDSLAKALYNALFNWVVHQINVALKFTSNAEVAIGILDIYGFEIFESNSFEQFCINFCNEKLQQIFIELVLKQEQEEYKNEGIKWTKIDYFDNQPILSLIESSKNGIFRLLDDACMFGKATPQTLLEKFDQTYSSKPQYDSYLKSGRKKKGPGAIAENAFLIKHYAGNVTYEIDLFLDKNRDTLFKSLIDCLQISDNRLVKTLFPITKSKVSKRPVTAGTQFKTSVNRLCLTLKKCEPHYIRCIKSNDRKAVFTVNEERIRHQIRYLNLVETVMVRRAGFCNRQPLIRFLARYKVVCPSTWPIWRGSPSDGVQAILDELKVDPEEYRMGKTKLFVRNVKTLTLLEKSRNHHLPKVAVKLQKIIRGFLARQWYKQNRPKMLLERDQTNAANIIQRKVKVYFTKRYAIEAARIFNEADETNNFGKDLRLPVPIGKAARKLDQLYQHPNLFPRWWATKKVGTLTEDQQMLMRQKVCTLECFGSFDGVRYTGDQKPWDCSRSFESDYLAMGSNPLQAEYKEAVQKLFDHYEDQQILFADNVIKVNKDGKSQLRSIIVTDKSIYKFDPKKYVIKKSRVPLPSILELHMSPNRDTFLVIQMDPPERDLVLDLGTNGCERLSEMVTILYTRVETLCNRSTPISFTDSITYNNNRNRSDALFNKEGENIGEDRKLVFKQQGGLEDNQFVRGKKGQPDTVLYS